MKISIACLLLILTLSNCGETKDTIVFVPAAVNEFHPGGLQLPVSVQVDSIKNVHDNCMGFSFEANALLAMRNDSFFIGTIINKWSHQRLNTLQDLGLSNDQIANLFNLVTNPCYEERALYVPIKAIFSEKLNLGLPAGSKDLSEEVNEAIRTSPETKITTGSWVYLDMTAALKRILDTATGENHLAYKKNLLDTANMVLTAAESITNIRFSITTEKKLSDSLVALLEKMPSATIAGNKNKLRLFYINSNAFQIQMDGFFPIIGQFTRAHLK